MVEFLTLVLDSNSVKAYATIQAQQTNFISRCLLLIEAFIDECIGSFCLMIIQSLTLIMTSIISGIHPILREPRISDTCSNDPIFLSLHSSSKMVLPIYIALASALVLFENSIFPIIQLFQPLVTVKNFLWLIPRMAGIIYRMIQSKSIHCNVTEAPHQYPDQRYCLKDGRYSIPITILSP